MIPSYVERKVRALLPLIRLLQACLPFPIMSWLAKQDMRHVRLGAHVAREAISADGVRCEWVIPRDSPRERTLLYLHGGGFVFGLTSLHLKMVAYLAEKMDIRALLVDYRVGPAHPFPAALDDCVTGYHWLLKQGIAAQNIVVAGDSAGGNLTLTMMMKLRDSGEPLPAAAACLSPVADLSNRAERAGEFNDPLIPPKAARIYNVSYTANKDRRDPLISPVFGDWHGLPPLLVHAGEDEFLRADAVRIEELARRAGVDVRLEIYPRMWHVWQLFLELPEAIQSLDHIAQFLNSRLGVRLGEREAADGATEQ